MLFLHKYDLLEALLTTFNSKDAKGCNEGNGEGNQEAFHFDKLWENFFQGKISGHKNAMRKVKRSSFLIYNHQLSKLAISLYFTLSFNLSCIIAYDNKDFFHIYYIFTEIKQNLHTES